MRSRHILVAAVAGGLFATSGMTAAQGLPGPMDDSPLTQGWAPSKWGADDRAGSSNHTQNSDNVRRAPILGLQTISSHV